MCLAKELAISTTELCGDSLTVYIDSGHIDRLIVVIFLWIAALRSREHPIIPIVSVLEHKPARQMNVGLYWGAILP